MARKFTRGLEARHEQDPSLLIRDTRTFGQKVSDFFHNPLYVASLLVLMAGTAFFLPFIADLIWLAGIGFFIFAYTRKLTLPFRLPQRSHLKDYNDLKAGSNQPNMAKGICYFGNEKLTNEELWFSNEDMRTHVLVFGSTGSGKTEALVSLTYNALLQGSGFIYVDGKGDNSLFAKIFSMARRMGREDDVLLVNFMTGARDIVGPQIKRLSNTLNPFATGSSSMLSQLITSMMDSASQSSDGDMWKGRAISFVEALMKLLTYMRDEEHILLDANTIRNYFHLSRLERIVCDKQFERDGQEAVNLDSAPEMVLEPINNYVVNLPGYTKEKKGKQVSQVLEQHGFITMQLTRIFSSLADTYGHIMRSNLAEVDLHDVVLNRRILIVLLPALEKSPDELSNLGKVIVATLKAMMASGLGCEVEGDYRDVIERKPTNAPTPFMCVLDEYGYYAVEGFSIVPAQARSLGFSTVFAGQDLPAFQKASKEEAASIGANTNIKIAMKLEDPIETWEFFMKTAGESFVTKVDHFQTSEDSVLNNYADSRSSSSEKRQRVDLLDLKDQRPGEAHIFFTSKIVRGRMFFANPKPVKYMRLNQFLKVEAPTRRQLLDMEKRLEQLKKTMASDLVFEVDDVESEEINLIIRIYKQNAHLAPIECAVLALLAFQSGKDAKEIVRQQEEEEEEELSTDQLNIFTKLRTNAETRELLLTSNLAEFSMPILDRSYTFNKIEMLERILGRNEQQSRNIAAEIMKDMLMATHYPPAQFELKAPQVALDEIATLIRKVKEKVAAQD